MSHSARFAVFRRLLIGTVFGGGLLLSCGTPRPAMVQRPTDLRQAGKPVALPAEARAAEITPGSFVYVGAQTRLFTQPAETNRYLTISPPALASGRGRYADLFRVMAVQGDWLAVTPVDIGEENPPSSCDSANYHFKGLALSFFVRRGETDPVVQRASEVKWPDGTQVTLRRGLHLVALDQPNLYQVWHEGISFNLFLSPGDVGRWYEGEVQRDEPPDTTRYLPTSELDPTHTGPKGEKRYRPTTRRMRFGGSGTMTFGRFPNTLFLQDERAASAGIAGQQDLLVSWSRKCVQARVIVDADWPADFGPGGLGLLMGGRTNAAQGIKQGAELFWPASDAGDGQKVGTTVAETNFSEPPFAEGQRRCFTRLLHPTHQMKVGGGSEKIEVAPEGKLVVCVAATDVVIPQPSEPAPPEK